MAVSRVIEVSFGRSNVALVRVNTAYFYNNGILFKPTDLDLPASYQVHWADSPDKATTIETIGTAEGAPIPDDLWNRSRVIYGWIYLHPTEDSGITGYEVRIYKNVRAGLPDGTEPTPAEQSTIDQLIGALNSAVEQAEDAQEAIENMSVSATTLAEGASATVTKSEQDGVVHLAFGIPKGATGDDGYSPTANVSKTGKVATITITDKNGTTSAQVEDGEDGIDGISPSVSVTDITGGHRVVITDKDGAKSFDVEDGATGATPNLTIGTVETLEPTESATATITGTPENPVLNLGIPQGDAGEVSLADLNSALIEKAPVITDTASGAIASFSDGADGMPLKSLVVDINPVQDLHGQDAPYPAGGGANKFDGIMVADGSYLLAANYIPVTEGQTWYIYTPNFPANDFCYGKLYDSNFSEIDAGTVHRIGRNTTYTIPSGVAYIKLRYWGTFDASNMAFNYPATVTTYSPYENICPISGHDTVEVLDDPACGGTIEWNQLVINGNMESNDGWVSAPQASGAFSVSNNILTCTMTEEAQYLNIVNHWQTQRLVKGHKYLYSVNVRSSAWADSNYRAMLILGAYWVQSIYTDIQAGTWVNISGIWTSTIENTIQATFRKYPDANYSPFDVKEFMVFDLTQMFGAGNEPSTVEEFRALFPNDYYPYNEGEKTTVSAVNNKPYTHVNIQLGQTVYGGKLDVLTGELVVYPYYASYNGETLTGEWISDRDKYVSGTTPTIGAQVVNIGAQGVTVQLEPHEVASLYGVNNIWADSGDTTAEYRADTKLFIERLTAPDSADMIADANITSGKYFMVGNSLYKATANIANGSAIVVGTNCTRKSLSEALNEINA